VAQLVRNLRGQGLAEWTIAGVLGLVRAVFKFARRQCGWRGENPVSLLERRERPKVDQSPERRISEDDELAQVMAAATEPWRTLFRLADIEASRESELLGLWWEDLVLGDITKATITFNFQVSRKGVRIKLKTNESQETLPLPRAAAIMLLEHKARSTHSGPKCFVFATRSGRATGQRNALRALHLAQERARKPTFPQLFEHDDRGHLAVDAKGQFIRSNKTRKDLKREGLALPDFHAMRHGAAMDCDDAEEARDLLRHKNSNVTVAVYRRHFTTERRESLREKLEARHAPQPRNEVGSQLRVTAA
jgi:integrase